MPAADATDPLELLPGKTICAMFGITAMSLWRWRRNPDLSFPEPIDICGRLYWRRRDLEAFLQRQAEKSATDRPDAGAARPQQPAEAAGG